MTIGDRIRIRRKELNLTQLQLAEKLNVTDRAVSKWEKNDGNPDFSILPALANALDLSLDYLITGKTYSPKENNEYLDDYMPSKKLVKCKTCGERVPAGAIYCPVCGEKI